MNHLQKQAIDSKNEIISNKNTEIEEKRKQLDKLEINMSDEERTIAQKYKIIVAQELGLKALETENITLAQRFGDFRLEVEELNLAHAAELKAQQEINEGLKETTRAQNEVIISSNKKIYQERAAQ